MKKLLIALLLLVACSTEPAKDVSTGENGLFCNDKVDICIEVDFPILTIHYKSEFKSHCTIYVHTTQSKLNDWAYYCTSYLVSGKNFDMYEGAEMQLISNGSISYDNEDCYYISLISDVGIYPRKTYEPQNPCRTK